MKIIYIGDACGTDSDFPLLRALQLKGVSVYAYYFVNSRTPNAGLFNIRLFEKNAIIPLSEYEGMKRYCKYFDMSTLYVINNYYASRKDIRYWYLLIKLIIHINKKHADIMHLTWPLSGDQRLLYWVRLKKILTVHDPFPHSGQRNAAYERIRLQGFNNSNGLVLLSKIYKDLFCDYYHIDKNRICVNKMGEFDYLRLLFKEEIYKSSIPYILFAGQIQPHKGIDLLMEAMLEVHKSFPNVKLVVAGKGDFYFDKSPYEKLNYIEIQNHFLTIEELVALMKGCLFAVCPYTDATQSGVVQTAFSLNIPLIVTNVGDLPLSVQDGVTGKVVPPCDVNALSDAMNDLLGHPEQLDSYKKNIEEIWRKGQRWEPIAQKYIEEYKKIISNN